MSPKVADFDSYSALERRLLEPGRRLVFLALTPFVRLLAALHISPHLVSISQIAIGAAIVMLVGTQPRLCFVLMVAAIALDGLDGALARHIGRSSSFGAILDQFCDHARETLVIAALAFNGGLSPLWATLYPLIYASFNFALFLCNYFGTPLPVAIKSYLVVYPAIFLYLWLGINWLDPLVVLCEILMTLVIAQGLWHLRGALERERG